MKELQGGEGMAGRGLTPNLTPHHSPPPLHLDLDLLRPEIRFRAVLVLLMSPSSSSGQEPGLRLLSENEKAVLAGFKVEKRRASWLAGRWAAKLALAAATGTQAADWSIGSGIFQFPLAIGPVSGWSVGITHGGPVTAALAWPDAHPLGLDFEPVSTERGQLLAGQFAPAELAFELPQPWSADEKAVLLWTAKEAVAKTLRTGLMTPLEVYSVADWRSDPKNPGKATFSYPNFGQYRGLALRSRAGILSLCHPAKTEVKFDEVKLTAWLDGLVNKLGNNDHS